MSTTVGKPRPSTHPPRAAADTIDQLVHRASPKTIARREITSVKGYFVDLRTGQPRTTNILKVVGGVIGTAVLFAVVRRVASD